jgi:hypothetical protein
MADLIRSAKSGGDWTRNDLIAYNIKVSSLLPDQFYGHPLPPITGLTGLDPLLVSGTVNTPGLSDETYRLLQYIDLASRSNSGQEGPPPAHYSMIGDCVREILRLLDYETRGLLLRSRYTIPLLICGDPNRSTQADVCLVQGMTTILLVVQVQDDKTGSSQRDPEAQAVAQAIAAFQQNNRSRKQLGKPELEAMTIPGITLTGTRPAFYLIPVTKELSDAVASAQYPSLPTVVKKCMVASGSCRLGECMESPDYRRLAFQCYIAFRILAQSHWSAFSI